MLQAASLNEPQISRHMYLPAANLRICQLLIRHLPSAKILPRFFFHNAEGSHLKNNAEGNHLKKAKGRTKEATFSRVTKRLAKNQDDLLLLF